MVAAARGTLFYVTPPGGVKTRVGRLTSVSELACEAEEIDITALDSHGGYREYLQGFRDCGTLELEGFHDAEDEGQAALRSVFDGTDAAVFETAFSDGAKAVFSGFVKKWAIGSAETDGAIGFSASVRVSGAVTYTAPPAAENETEGGESDG